jgi:hypothetical protein
MSLAAPVAAAETGPSSSESPYLIPAADGVATVAILTVGDTPTNDPSYRMVGIPDGLGAYRNVAHGRSESDADDRHRGGRTFTLLANHELRAEQGRVRAHGATGSFVSKWTIDRRSLEVVAGEDLIQYVRTWGAGSWNAPAKGIALNRLCSADLPAESAFYDQRSQRGYRGQIFLSGEEAGDEGRPFGHLLDGTSYELAHLGNMSYENIVANAETGTRTMVAALDDQTNGQVYVYLGDKQRSGNPIERAGLAGGALHGVRIVGMPQEPDAPLPQQPLRFELARLGDVADRTGAEIEAESNALGVTRFLRPEDGAWDPNEPRDFYFVTTDNYDSTKPEGASSPGGTNGHSRLWRLRFDDLGDPASGGTVTPLLAGTEIHQMLDNMTVDTTGHVLIQEDPGNQTRSAKIWQYTIATGELKLIARHDPVRFGESQPPRYAPQLPAAAPATTDEESSGIIPAFDILGPGWFLLDVQAHTAPRPPFTSLQPELVEDGQFLALYNPDSDWTRKGVGARGR